MFVTLAWVLVLCFKDMPLDDQAPAVCGLDKERLMIVTIKERETQEPIGVARSVKHPEVSLGERANDMMSQINALKQVRCLKSYPENAFNLSCRAKGIGLPKEVYKLTMSPARDY